MLFNQNAIETAAGGYTIEKSLRLRSSASAYLNRTPASAGSRQVWTWSAWVKRGTLGTLQVLFCAGADASNNFRIGFSATDSLFISNETSGVTTTLRDTTAVFRDPSSWYHIVVVMNTLNITASQRIKLYVNGVEITAFASSANPTQFANLSVNNTVPHFIGVNYAGSYFDGYLADVNLVSGNTLTPSDFGESDSTTGSWKPKRFTGSYGGTGFFLQFKDTSSTTNLVKDTSGQGNNWTPNNISLTAGVTYDSMLDSPTMGVSGTQPFGNYCVLNALDKKTTGTLSSANSTITAASVAAVGSIGVSSGKWYWEVYSSGTTTKTIGIEGTVNAKTQNLTTTGWIALRLDLDGGAGGGLDYSTDGTNWTNITKTNFLGAYFPYIANGTTAQTITINCGQQPFNFTPPAGFNSVCTTNLPDSTIVKGNQYMDATLYTGTGASQSIQNAAGFSPGLVWIKSRSAATDNSLYDVIRTANRVLVSNSTATQATQTQGLTAFNSNGFTVGTLASVNTSAATYVGWQWNTGSSTVTNTSGTISSQVRANTTSGVSIVSYTGTGANATIGHGLGVTPKMIIVKRRTTTADDWYVWHSALTNFYNIKLNTTSAQTLTATVWNSTNPTASVFSVGSSAGVNASSANYTAYCFSEVPGFSSFGSYAGNGNTDGPFVYLGFRPKFVMIKRSDATVTAGNWMIFDSSRSPFNQNSVLIHPNLIDAEVAISGGSLQYNDFVSNGLKLRSTGSNVNANGGTYIYMAFAENPFKNSLAR